MSRWKYFLQRVVLTVPILLFAMSIVFLIVRAGPQDPARAIVGMGNPAGYHEVAVNLGIERQVTVNGETRYVDVPLWEQYVDFMTNLLTFNLGQSWVIYESTSVYDYYRAPGAPDHLARVLVGAHRAVRRHPARFLRGTEPQHVG